MAEVCAKYTRCFLFQRNVALSALLLQLCRNICAGSGSSLLMEDKTMELTGELKKMVENASSKDEARDLIEKAGIRLTEDELDMVAGGLAGFKSPAIVKENSLRK